MSRQQRIWSFLSDEHRQSASDNWPIQMTMHAAAINRPMRVLVVDDEPSSRSFAVRVLHDAGYAVDEASDGPDALRIVDREGLFDVFVIDVVMPGMRGDELARRLRQRDPDVKVLYFTGYSDRLFEEREMLWENEAFIEKPVSVRGLLEALAMMLFGHIRGDQTRRAKARQDL